MVWFYHNKRYTKKIQHWKLSIPLWSDFIIINSILKKYNIENFQSHYGLILSHRIQLHKWWPSRFQSHYGLILSCECRAWCVVPETPFNPTMVWFYHKDGLIDNADKVDFQSHYGLILSAVSGEFGLAAVLSFNPTMVWFYHKRGGSSVNRVIQNFQSHYGLILSNLCRSVH